MEVNSTVKILCWMRRTFLSFHSYISSYSDGKTEGFSVTSVSILFALNGTQLNDAIHSLNTYNFGAKSTNIRYVIWISFPIIKHLYHQHSFYFLIQLLINEFYARHYIFTLNIYVFFLVKAKVPFIIFSKFWCGKKYQMAENTF